MNINGIDTALPVDQNLTHILNQSLVVDIETSSFYPNGKEISIQSDFDNYVKYAQVKWIGMYSFRENKSYTFHWKQDLTQAYQLLANHQVLIGFNIEDFDLPILVNNAYIKDPAQYLIVDIMVILGNSSFLTKKGYPYKNRGTLMDYDFPSNSLRSMAEVMKVETQKGEIDYKIFQKYEWTEEEKKEIIKYLLGDIMSTKQMFDKLWSYWLPFTQFLPPKSIYDLSWIRGSIASVVYKSACHLLGVEPTYSDKVESKTKEKMGGNVIEPVQEESWGVWYLDYASLYPHIMTMFNLFAEVAEGTGGKWIWHGNKLFQVRGYYDISHPHPLAKLVTDMLAKRLKLKKDDPKNPLVYTYKIFLNGLYGVIRSPIFEQIHVTNGGWDTCWLGQQVQGILIQGMSTFGFSVIAGDTDSGFFIAKEAKYNVEDYVRSCLKEIINHILENVPFKVSTFDVAIEHYIDYIKWPFDFQPVVDDNTRKILIPILKRKEVPTGYEEKTDGKKKVLIDCKTKEIVRIGRSWVEKRKGKKKNYLYIWTDKKGIKNLEVKGLPVIKNNATALGYEIYENVLKKKILEQVHASFSRVEIESIIDGYLKQPNAMELISQEYRVKAANGYKKAGQIQGQISRAYFGGGDGVIRLIKNNIVGKVGKGKTKYCTIAEAIENKLAVNNLELTKLWNELKPFLVYEETDGK